MAEYDNTNSGALFKNDRKTSQNHPDYRGSVNVEGVEFWVSAWIKTPRSGGDKFLSVSLTPKESQQSTTRQSARNSDADDFLSSPGVSAAAAAAKARHQSAKDDLPGGPQRPPQRPAPQDFDSFDDDIPF